MTGYYQRGVMERTGAVFKTGDSKTRCNAEIDVRGSRQTCNQILAKIHNHAVPGGRYEVRCRRCGAVHVI